MDDNATDWDDTKEDRLTEWRELNEPVLSDLADEEMINGGVIIEVTVNPVTEEKDEGTGKRRTGDTGFRFNDSLDIQLLTECQTEEIWKGSYKETAVKWRQILKSLAFKTCVATIQNRYKKLMDAHKSENSESLRSSGTVEQKTEKKSLMEGIVNSMKDHQLTMAQEKHDMDKTQKEKKTVAGAKRIRESAMQTLANKKKRTEASLDDESESCHSPPPSQSVSPTNNNADIKRRRGPWDIVADTQAKELSLKEKTLEFEKLKLEEAKKEREERYRIEERKMDIQEELVKSQQNMMNNMMLEMFKLLKK